VSQVGRPDLLVEIAASNDRRVGACCLATLNKYVLWMGDKRSGAGVVCSLRDSPGWTAALTGLAGEVV